MSEDEQPQGVELERKIERDHAKARTRLHERRKAEPLSRVVLPERPQYVTILRPGRYRLDTTKMGGDATRVVLTPMPAKKERRSG